MQKHTRFFPTPTRGWTTNSSMSSSILTKGAVSIFRNFKNFGQTSKTGALQVNDIYLIYKSHI